MFIKFTRQNLTLLTIHLKNVYLCIFIFGCTAIFSYFISFAVSTSSALKEHHVNLCSLPSPLSYLGAHPKHSKVGDFWDLNLFSPISKYFFFPSRSSLTFQGRQKEKKCVFDIPHCSLLAQIWSNIISYINFDIRSPDSHICRLHDIPCFAEYTHFCGFLHFYCYDLFTAKETQSFFSYGNMVNYCLIYGKIFCQISILT